MTQNIYLSKITTLKFLDFWALLKKSLMLILFCPQQMDVATPILINMFSAFAGIPIQIQCILLQYSHVAQVALIM